MGQKGENIEVGVMLWLVVLWGLLHPGRWDTVSDGHPATDGGL